ncbi:MAG TPA: hypothetical protein VFK06_15150 [Candidatus Angelobacter sp.]|nr:hypothetical protein [Candidatus Angelobacter sp.]
MSPEDHPDAVELNRKLILTALSVLCLQSEKRRQTAEHYRQLWAKDYWFSEQLWKHVPRSERPQLIIDFEVNEMDPNFDFQKAAVGIESKPIP